MLAVNVFEMFTLTVVMVALYGPTPPEHDVAASVAALPPRPFTVSAIVGVVPPQAAASVTDTVIAVALLYERVTDAIVAVGAVPPSETSTETAGPKIKFRLLAFKVKPEL